jgi:signal transduction histidine kinase
VRQHLYLIVKEAMTNAARHANAARVLVAIGLNGSQLQIRVEDDGVGWQRGNPEGNGLRNMQRRAARIGAQLDFRTQTGACLEVTVDLANPHFHGSPATT